MFRFYQIDFELNADFPPQKQFQVFKIAKFDLKVTVQYGPWQNTF